MKKQLSSPFEIVGNFHLHTNHSDGAGSHRQVAEAAAQAGLDVIVYTDHNRWVPGNEGWYTHPQTARRVLLIMGEEVHDVGRSPEGNHYLCLGVDRDLRDYARLPQALINQVDQCGGVGFIAHPIERSAPVFGEPELPWVDWDVTGFTGIELWNYMSEFKAYLSSKPAAILAALFPSLWIRGPFLEALALWDGHLSKGDKVVVIGGADAHANTYSIGPLKRAIFPYEYLFHTVNTHLLLDEPFRSESASAKAQVLGALRAGHAFVAYDLAGKSRSFRFTASNHQSVVSMGDDITLDGPVTLEVSSPLPAHLRLLADGYEVAGAHGRDLVYQTKKPGVFRVEAYRRYRLRRRGWVFTNPIYVQG